MPNTIEYAKRYTSLLDEVYMRSALTGVLESDSSLSRAGANVNEIIIPKIDMDGLADYDRNSGYVKGDESLTWETKQFNYERGRMFTVDNMDNEETQNIAFGRLAGEFIRTKVVPEIDAFRFAYYASVPGAASSSEELKTGAAAIGSLRKAVTTMDEEQVPSSERILFITPTLKGMLDDLDTYKSKAVLSGFSQIISVPQSRFYTKIDLLDGKSEGETAGGYKKAASAANINYLIIYKPAVIQFTKHAVPKTITPEANQDADAWKYGYRIYGISSYFENKVSGIYCSHAPAPTLPTSSEDES